MSVIGQGQPDELDFHDYKKHPIGDLNITGVDVGGTVAPYIDLIEPYTDLDHIMASAETLPELVECKNIPTINLQKDMGIAKNDGTLEAEDQIIDPAVP